jgi:hypothetical protein
MPSGNLSWREKLVRVRDLVVEAEKEREMRKQQEKERSREALAERLKKDTPEALINQFNDLKKRCQQVARKVYPPDNLREQLASLAALGNKLRLYKDTQREHGSLFSLPMKQTLNRLLNSLGEIQRSLDKQLGQWQGVEQILNATAFRARQPSDAPRLLEIAKSFSREAYQITLSLPNDYFASESQHFHVAQSSSGVYAYVRYWPDSQTVAFALTAPGRVNFKKLVRGFLHVLCKRGPEGPPTTTIRVRISDPREFKFYQELGFRRDSTVTAGLVVLVELG